MTPPHGTNARRVKDGCTCRPCRNAAAEYARDRYRAMAYGQWNPKADPEPVRAHVRALMEFGISLAQIADASGVSLSTISRIMYFPASGWVRPSTAESVLGVPRSLDLVADMGRTDGVGTKRRVRALVARGWSTSALARRLGMDRRNLSRALHGDRVTGRVARLVRDLYDDLWDQEPPATNRFERRAVTLSKDRAKARGWAPPLAWDDDVIDDPSAKPDLGKPSSRRLADVVEDVEELERLGEPPERVAARVGVRPESVARYKLRARKRLGVSAA